MPGGAENFEQYINKSEISHARTVEEFICWFEKKLTITIERRSLRRQNLLHKGIAKIFYEELFPLYRLLQNKAKDWKKEKIMPIIGNQNYDVEVRTNRKDVPRYIEITTADMNEEEKYRMQYFLEHGHVVLTGRVSIKKDKKAGKKINIESECKNHNERTQEIKDMIKKRITKKISAPKRPDNTGLLVYYADYRCFNDADAALKQEMAEFINSVELPWQTQYSMLYMVDASGKSFFEKHGKN